MHQTFSVFGSEGHSLAQRSVFNHRENGTRTTQTGTYLSVCSLFLTNELGNVIVLGEPNTLHDKDSLIICSLMSINNKKNSVNSLRF